MRRACPAAGSPAIDRIPRPSPAAHAPLPGVLEGEQHLRGLVDRRALMATDQRGVARPQGGGCDAGAIEVAR